MLRDVDVDLRLRQTMSMSVEWVNDLSVRAHGRTMSGLEMVVHEASHFLYLAQKVTSTGTLPFLAYL
jgi:hypothetical protein